MAGLFKVLQLKCRQQLQPSLPVLSLASLCLHPVWADSVSQGQGRPMGVQSTPQAVGGITSGAG